MKKFAAWSAALLMLAVAIPVVVSAQSAADIQKQIDDNNAQVTQLDADITQYQTQLDAVSAKKQTLQTTLSQLSLSIKKVTASISLTKNQIHTTQLQIQQLSSGIADKQTSIQTDQAGLIQALQSMSAAEQLPLVVQLLNADTISDAWQNIETLESFQDAVNTRITALAAEKQSLADTKTAQEAKQAQLLKQQQTLTSQQGSLAATQKAQSDLLAQTKNQETNYETIIAQKQAQAATLQQALSNLKSQYNQAVNPSQITAPGQGVLQWPIAGHITITQYFGDTPFAQANPSLYSGHGHDGLDIAAPIGTPVHAALSGVILGTGNTDLAHSASGAQCYSFGKWVMIKHTNGLNTMYAHLSEIDVTVGQSVTTGDVIGYSGETGYATGPHLHFGVYVTAVTQILALGKATNTSTPCATAVMPVPPVSGYLNPLNYLPKTSFTDDT